MKRYAMWVGWMCGCALLVACGGDLAGPTDAILDVPRDASRDDAPIDAPNDATDAAPTGGGPCNLLTQSGCGGSEKCTWLLDALSPSYAGHIGCSPNGPATAGDTCMFGSPGVTGFDNCGKGLVCSNYRGGGGICKKVCDLQGGTPTCDVTTTCVTYSGLFSTSNAVAAGGLCDRACNPLEDNDFDGSGSDTKGSNACGSGAYVGCYGYPSYGTPPATGWSCTNDINADQAQPIGLRHRVECNEANNCADAGPQIYVNSCNQGYLPLLYDTTGSTKIICVALCKPLPCYGGIGNCTTSGTTVTGVNGNRDGQPPHECRTVNRVGSFTATEHCQYLWWREVDDSGNLLSSTTSDAVGVCMDFSKYKWDSNGDNKADSADMNFPNCDTLEGSGFGSGSDRTMPNTYFGPADLGCVPSTYLPPMATGKRRTLPATAMQKRALTNLPRALYRRTMTN